MEPDTDSLDSVLSLVHIPRQGFLSPKFADMRAILCSHPPLGQITSASNSLTKFIVQLQINASREDDDWEVYMWYTDDSSDNWRELPLSRTSNETPQCLQLSDAHSETLHFAADLNTTGPISFTFKFRNGHDQPWKWVKDSQDLQDGLVLPKSLIEKDTSPDLTKYIHGLDPAFKVQLERSQAPQTTLWSVTASVAAARGKDSSFTDIKIGVPWGNFLKYFASVRLWAPWLAPRQGGTHFKLDSEAVMCSFLSHTGQHMVFLAISGIADTMSLFLSDEEGNIILHVRNDSQGEGSARVVVALGDEFEPANAAAMYHARNIVRMENVMTGEEQMEVQALTDGIKPMWQENWFDGLTYCTWNALGQQLTDEKVYHALDELAKANIHITNLIIDDNWQALDYRGPSQFQHGWREFEADRQTFPDGLKKTISNIRDKHPHIQHIAVWHAIMGYWGGLAPDGPLAKEYKTVEVIRDDSERRNLPLGGKMTVVAREDVPRFYDDFYKFLDSCGIDAVKTDAQFILDTMHSAQDRVDLINTYLDSWMVSSLRYFSVKAISCMSQTPHILFHSQMPTNRPAVLVRNSDDFFPEIPESHPWHIWVNAHNALFTQHLNLIPDWDMFQTVHSYSGFHAAARCISGGPVYITDEPGSYDLDLVNQMTGPTPRGKTVIFRPSVIGKALDQYNSYTSNTLLKVGSYHGMAVVGTSFLAAFNVSKQPLSELIHLERFPGVVQAQYYVIRAHSSGKVSKIMQVVQEDALVSVTLDVRGYEIFSAFALRGFIQEEREIWVANLGLLGKMTGAAAIVDSKTIMQETGRIDLDTNLKALGTLGLYISDLKKRNIKETLLVIILGQVIPVHCLKISNADDHVLEIDVQRAWKELGLDSKWSNEVEVKVYISQLK